MLGKSWQTGVALFTFAAIEVAELQRSIFEQCEFYSKILPLSFPTVWSHRSTHRWLQMPQIWVRKLQMKVLIVSFNLVLDDIIFESNFNWDSLSNRCNASMVSIFTAAIFVLALSISNLFQCIAMFHHMQLKTFKCGIAVTCGYITRLQITIVDCITFELSSYRYVWNGINFAEGQCIETTGLRPAKMSIQVKS